MSGHVEIRRSARAVVIDESDRVLLLHGRVQELPPVFAWYTPGGRLEASESWEEAVRRELAEELGLRGVEIGPHIWTRRSVRRRGDVDIPALARFFLVRVPQFTPDISRIGPSEVDVDWRWWSHDELLTQPDVRVIPSRLAQLLAPLLHGELPAEPFDAT